MDVKNVEIVKFELEYFLRVWLIFVLSFMFWFVCKGRDINIIEGEWFGKYWWIEWFCGVKICGKNVFCIFLYIFFFVFFCVGYLVCS